MRSVLMRHRSKKGEVHEAFNLGLDKSLDSTSSHIEKEEEVAGQLKHSENLWPEESAWSKAGQFVRPTFTNRSMDAHLHRW